MSIYVACRCGQAFSAGQEYAGHTLPCPACGQALFVPHTAAALVAPMWQPLAAPPAAQPTARRPAGPNTALLVGGIVGGVVAIGALALVMSRAMSKAPGQAAASPQPQAVGESSPAPVAPLISAPPRISEAPREPLPETPAALTDGMKVDTLPIAGGMYQLVAPGSEWDGHEGPGDSGRGITFRGGAHFRHQLEGDRQSGRLVHVNWTVLVRPQDLTEDKQNPEATPVTINGLAGHEVREQDSSSYRHHLHFTFADHSLTVTFRCPEDRLDSPEVQRVKQSLRRLNPVPPEILAMQKPQPPKSPKREPPAESVAKGSTTPAPDPFPAASPSDPNQLVMGRGSFTLLAPGAKLLYPEQAGGQRGGNEFFIGVAQLPNGVELRWFLVYMPNRDSDLKTEVLQHFNRRGQMTPPGSENATETPVTVNGIAGVEKRFSVPKKAGHVVVQRVIHLGDHALYYTAIGAEQLVDASASRQVLDSLQKGF